MITLACHCGRLTFVLLYCARDWSLAKTTLLLQKYVIAKTFSAIYTTIIETVCDAHDLNNVLALQKACKTTSSKRSHWVVSIKPWLNPLMVNSTASSLN